MSETRALARRMALMPGPSLRLNKAIAMLGMQAAGFYAGLLLEGTLSTVTHASHNEYSEKLLRTQLDEGMKAFLRVRDGPFQPEPMGPRSLRARQEAAGLADRVIKRRRPGRFRQTLQSGLTPAALMILPHDGRDLRPDSFGIDNPLTAARRFVFRACDGMPCRAPPERLRSELSHAAARVR